MPVSPSQPDRLVRLTQDIPEKGLHTGQVGTVCSTWFSPQVAYEVEFRPVGLASATRALLLASQIQEAELSAN